MPQCPYTYQSPVAFVPSALQSTGLQVMLLWVGLCGWGRQVHGRFTSQVRGIYISPRLPVVSTPLPSWLTSVYSSSLFHSQPEVPSVFSFLSEFPVSTRWGGLFSAHCRKAQGLGCTREGLCAPSERPALLFPQHCYSGVLPMASTLSVHVQPGSTSL